MYKALTCVALRTVKYSDRTSILSAYSAQQGRVALAVPAGRGREAARLRALLMPMAVFECEADIRPGRDICAIRDVRALVPPAAANPVASVQALFLADLLQGVLREPLAEAALFACLSDGARRLFSAASDPSPRGHATLANLHLAFILRLLRFMGVEPDWSTYRPGALFDMVDGIFRSMPPAHPRYLPADESLAAWQLRRMTMDNCHRFRFSRADRNLLLDRLTDYLRLPFATLGALPSVDILRHTFDF